MKKLFLITVCAIMILALGSCAASATQDKAASMDVAMEAEAPAAEEAAYDGGAYGEADAAVEEGAVAGAAASGEGAGLGDLPNMTIPDTNRKLVYSSSFDINSRRYDEDYARIKSALDGANGYIEYENTYSNNTDYGSSRHSGMTLRVPVENYNSFLDTLSGIGTVVNKDINAEDISDQYYDTDARIEILENRQARLLEYLDEARKMEDIIALEQELSDVLYELDQLKGSKRGMDQLISYSRVTVNLNEEITAETLDAGGDPLGERAANAYNMSLTNVGQFLQDFLVGLAAAAPVLILLAIIAVIVFVIVRLVKRARRQWVAKHGEKPRASRPAMQQPPQSMNIPPQGMPYPPQGMRQPQAPPADTLAGKDDNEEK